MIIKIAFTFLLFGYAGLVINMFICAPTNKIKYHLYSSIPCGIGGILIAINEIWFN